MAPVRGLLSGGGLDDSARISGHDSWTARAGNFLATPMMFRIAGPLRSRTADRKIRGEEVKCVRLEHLAVSASGGRIFSAVGVSFSPPQIRSMAFAAAGDD